MGGGDTGHGLYFDGIVCVQQLVRSVNLRENRCEGNGRWFGGIETLGAVTVKMMTCCSSIFYNMGGCYISLYVSKTGFTIWT